MLTPVPPNQMSINSRLEWILDKYKDVVEERDLDSIEIGYENNKFVYSAKVLKDDSILYIYYDLYDGEFLKAYHLKRNE